MKITHAAVRIEDKRRNTVIVIPCHRHHDAFIILKEFGYTPGDYKVIDQGFLVDGITFVDRKIAKTIAHTTGQDNTIGTELFSEELW